MLKPGDVIYCMNLEDLFDMAEKISMEYPNLITMLNPAKCTIEIMMEV